jgi:hypothetical protein
MGLFIFSLSLPLSATDTYRATAKELYELRERCGKTCAQRFKEEYGKEGIYSDNDEKGARSYNSHYNTKLNKCFILITDMDYGPNNGGLIKLLWDVNENKEYGQLILLQKDKLPFSTKVSYCRFLEKQCYSEQEWDLLVKSYMEE